MSENEENGYGELRGNRAGGGAIAFLLCFIPMLATVAFGGVDSWALGILAVLTSLIAVFWAIDVWKTGELRFSASRLQLPIVALLIVGCVQLLPIGGSAFSPDLLNAPASTALSLDPYATRLFLVRLAVYLLFFAAALTYINSTERLKKISAAVVIFGAAMAFFAILQRLANPDGIYGLRQTPQAIPFGPFVNQHHFAALMELLSGVALGMLFCGHLKKDRKIMLAMAAVVMGIAVIFTGSRGGLIAYTAVVALAVGSKALGGDRRSRNGGSSSGQRKLAAFFAVVAVLLTVLGTAVFLGGGEGLLRGLGPGGAETDITSGRSHFWSIALHIFRDHPLIGVGLDAFGAAFPRYDSWNGFYRVEQAHNDYLQILADAGVLGFTCVVGFVVLLFREGTAAIRNAADGFGRGAAVGALAGCSGIVVHSFFDFPLRTPANAFFFLLVAALMTAAVVPAKKKDVSGR